MQMKHKAPAWGAGCSNRYSHTKVLPASFPGALGSGNIHATHRTCTSPGFTAQQGVLPSLKSLHYHLKFSPPVINISCTGTKCFSDLFSILSLLTHHLQFPFHHWGSKLTPKFSLLYLFISLPGPFLCLPPVSLLPCPKSRPAFCAGRLVLGSAGTEPPGCPRAWPSMSCPHFQVNVLSARNPTVPLAKAKVRDVIRNLCAWMLSSPPLPLPRTSVPSWSCPAQGVFGECQELVGSNKLMGSDPKQVNSEKDWKGG